MVVASKNPVKIEAVKNAVIYALRPGRSTLGHAIGAYARSTVTGQDVSNGFSVHPFGDTEILTGAQNRLNGIVPPRESSKRFFAVSIESGIVEQVMPTGETRYFDKAWVLVRENDTTVAVQSLAIEVPEKWVLEAKESGVISPVSKHYAYRPDILDYAVYTALLSLLK